MSSEEGLNGSCAHVCSVVKLGTFEIEVEGRRHRSLEEEKVWEERERGRGNS